MSRVKQPHVSYAMHVSDLYSLYYFSASNYKADVQSTGRRQRIVPSVDRETPKHERIEVD